MALVTSACSATTPGEPTRRELPPILAEEALGDFRTLDYCGLLDPPEVSDDVGYVGGPLIPSIRACEFIVRNDDDRWTPISSVGYLGKADDRLPDADSRAMSRGLTVYEGVGSARRCERALHFADDYLLEIAAYDDERPTIRVETERSDAERKRALCAIADSTADLVSKNLSDGEIRRLTELSSNSLVGQDLCDVIPKQLLRDLDLSVTAMNRKPDGHTCDWFGEDGQLVASSYIGLRGEYSFHDEPTEIAGRTTIRDVRREDDQSRCRYAVLYAEFPAKFNMGEEFSIEVVDRSGGDGCATAERIAREVWPKLPDRETG